MVRRWYDAVLQSQRARVWAIVRWGLRWISKLIILTMLDYTAKAQDFG